MIEPVRTLCWPAGCYQCRSTYVEFKADCVYTGVTAYLGAAGLIEDSSILSSAASKSKPETNVTYSAIPLCCIGANDFILSEMFCVSRSGFKGQQWRTLPCLNIYSCCAVCAEILAVEAYHAGIIRTLLYQQRDTETPYNETVAEIVQAISALRASVGGGADQGIVEETANGDTANIVPADTTTSLAFSRTPAEVSMSAQLALSLEFAG